MSSTLLLVLGQSGVTGRLWSAAFGNNAPPDSFDASIGYPGVWDVRATSPDEPTLGYQGVPQGQTRVWLRKDGCQDYQFDTNMPDDGAIAIEMKPQPLTRITVNGFDLVKDGWRWFAKGCSDFLLYKKFLDGEDISGLLKERAALGANIVRIFGMCENITRFHPQDYGERYYQSAQAFCEFIGTFGMYVYFTVFADTRLVMPDGNEQAGHWARMCDELKKAANTLVEVGNELDQHDNAIAFAPHKPDGIVACCGSLGGDTPCLLPAWDLSDFHARRDYPKAIVDMCCLELRDGYPGYAGTHGPVWQGEPQGFGPNPKRWQDPARARELAGTARGTCAGIYFHSDNGVYSQPFDSVTKSCADAFFAELV